MPAPYREKQNLWKSITSWFFKPDDWGLGPVVDTKPERSFAHFHSWEFYNAIRCGWIVEEGRPVGERISINMAILDRYKFPNQNETTVSQLKDWQKSGYEYVHLSQRIYKCKHCELTKKYDVYCTPVKADGTGPLIVDFNSHTRFQKKFTETTRIPVAINNRKEFAIEPMKRHGVRPKVKKELPVVPMEN